MQEHRYEELKWFPCSDLGLEPRQAVDLAQGEALGRAVSQLRRGRSVLVMADKELSAPAYQVLAERARGLALQEVAVNMGTREGAGSPPGGSVPTRLLHQLLALLSSTYPARDQVLVIRHLDLMTWTATGQARPELNDIAYWLAEYGETVKVVAFWDPVYELPKIIEDLFPSRVSLEGFSREVLWKLVGPAEARLLCEDECFSISAQLRLYHYLSGMNVVEVRRLLRDLPDALRARGAAPKETREAAFACVRQLTSPAAVQTLSGTGEVVGYEEVRRRLEREVIFPFRLRYSVVKEDELPLADALVPRGLILYGPPGTGKTEWAKYLVHRLNAALLVINGPELKHHLVGGTEEAIRRLFAQARRLAPSVILIDELDALTPARHGDQAAHDQSMVNQFLTEMQGLREHETVLVVGTTNRVESLDEAFIRPGRFGVRIEVGPPEKADRSAILTHYSQMLQLGLTPESIAFLVEQTGTALDQEAEETQQRYREACARAHFGAHAYDAADEPLRALMAGRFGARATTRFSGDHLRAICQHVLRELQYSRNPHLREDKEAVPAPDVNDRGFLAQAVEAVCVREQRFARSRTGASSPWATGGSRIP